MASPKIPRSKSVPMRVLNWPVQLLLVGVVDRDGGVHFNHLAAAKLGLRKAVQR